MRGIDCPKIVSGRAIYLRLHGTLAKYDGAYPGAQLTSWANWLKRQSMKRIYVYFNNDAYGYAVKNALRLKELL